MPWQIFKLKVMIKKMDWYVVIYTYITFTSIEEEIHFLMGCSAFEQKRQDLINFALKTCYNDKNLDTVNVSNLASFMWTWRKNVTLWLLFVYMFNNKKTSYY